MQFYDSYRLLRKVLLGSSPASSLKRFLVAFYGSSTDRRAYRSTGTTFDYQTIAMYVYWLGNKFPVTVLLPLAVMRWQRLIAQ